MKLNFFKYLVFVFFLLFVAMWSQMNLFISSFGRDTVPTTSMYDEKLISLVDAKTGVKLGPIIISESSRLFGMMVGIPGKPHLVLSRNLYETFSEAELEYVLLHEAGHSASFHTVKETFVGLLLFVAGVLLIRRVSDQTNGVIYAVILGIGCGVLLIQFGKYSELQADVYALERLSDPQGMIDATEKFRAARANSFPQNKTSQFFLERKNPYENRIRMAEEEIKKR